MMGGQKMNKTMIISILGIILLAVGISGCTDSSDTISPEELKSNATAVTANQLYSNSISNGTAVKMTGYVLDIQEGTMRVAQIKNYGSGITGLDYDNDIMVTGDFGSDFYENEEVNIWGIFEGSTSYDTAMGGQRTIPRIGSAIAEKTGNRYKS